MKKIKMTKERLAILMIAILSAVLNFANISVEGTSNSYYAAAAKSMTMSFKNFFFVSFDPAGFVSIDKPPVGFWLQAISAKIFGFSGWSIILPQALAGVISVVLIYIIVKKSFGPIAGLISALCLAVTPVFVAISRNNSIDNTLVMTLLFACWALSIAAEKGKLKYLIISMVLVGVGFNIKMLEAYMVGPALYLTYLLSTAVSIKKRIIHLVAATVVLVAVSLSWAIIVDLVPASSRPYVDSSTNNTVMELIFGHNGSERLSLGGSSSGGPGGGGFSGGNGNGQRGNFQGGNRQQGNMQNGNQQTTQNQGNTNNGQTSTQSQSNTNTNSGQTTTQNQSNTGNVQATTQATTNAGNGQGSNQGFPGGQQGGMQGDGQMGGGQGGGFGGSSGLQGTFGGQVKAGLQRLFSKNILADQVVWFIPLAILGFIAAAIKEKLRIRLDNKKQQALVLWFVWFFPEFIYFSFNTGLFHPYYLTMMATPIAALTGIGLTSMWELYNEGGWKSWFLPASLLVNGAAQLLMLYYFISSGTIIKILMVLLIVLCFVSSIILAILNLAKKENNNEADNEVKLKKDLKFKRALVSLALVGLIVTPLTGSAAAIVHGVGSTIPVAGLELLSSNGSSGKQMGGGMPGGQEGGQNSKLVQYLLKNKTANQKYLLVVTSSNSASNIIIQTGEAVMAMGGFQGSDNAITLEQFKELVKKGEIRYVMTGGMGGGMGNNRQGTADGQEAQEGQQTQYGEQTQYGQQTQGQQQTQYGQNTKDSQNRKNGMGGQESQNEISEIMSWVEQNGKLVSSSEYSDSTSNNTQQNTQSTTEQGTEQNTTQNYNQNTTQNTQASNGENSKTTNTESKDGGRGQFGGMESGQLYDLKSYTDSLTSK